MIDIKDLEAFLAILDSGSISKAAEDIGLTQPALSLKLKKMESELGIPLFQRTPRNVVPLEAARIIEPKARDILAKLDGVREALAKSVSELKGQVRIGCLMGWFDTLMVPCVSAVRAVAPQVKIRLHADQTESLIHRVAHGQLDMAVVAHPFEQTEGIVAEPLFEEQLVLVGTDLPDEKKAEKRREALLARPWVTMTIPDPLLEKWWRQQFEGENFPWESASVPVSVDHIVSIPAVLKAIPNALAVVPNQIVQKAHREASLEVSQSVSQSNTLFLIWRSEGMELQRYKVVKDAIIQQVKAYADSL